MKHTSAVFISKEMVQQLNEKHGWFEFRDAQSDVSNAFANEAIERYERIRAAAPDLLAALQLILPLAKGYAYQHQVGSNQAYCEQAELAIAKAVQS